MSNTINVLNITKIPNVKYIKKIPDMETIHTKSSGTLYGIKYMVDSGDGKKMIRIESKDKSFKSVYAISLYDIKLKPVGQLILKDGVDKDFMEILSKTITGYKLKSNLKENFISSNFIENILYENEADYAGFEKTMFRVKTGLKIGSILQGAFFFFGVTSLIYVWYKKIHNWLTENVIVPKEEQKMNEELFVGQTKRDSAFIQYQTTVNHINLLTHGNANAIILCGPPGMSKTYIVKRTLFLDGYIPHKEYIIEKGAAMGLADVYTFLYKNRKKIIVLDDFDSPLKNPDITNMLKSITDTYGKRILSMPREKLIQGGQEQTVYEAPNKFEFSGKLIIVTNLEKKQIEPALLSRAPAHEIHFNTKEILESVEKMMKYISPSVSIEIKQEVFEYLSELYRKDPKNININFRTYVTAIDARVGNPEGWKDMVKLMVNN